MGIRVNGVSKFLGTPPTRVLDGISFEIHDGDYVSVTGRSGSGKSTLLYLLSTLDAASEGSVEIDGRDVRAMTEAELSRFRNARVGFVFQFNYLLSELTAFENVLLPARKHGEEAARRNRAQELLERFGLGDKGRRLPRQLSGGEQQRVAIARALVMEPGYVFADEPTGSLDTENSETVMKILEQANRDHGTTIVMVTHEADYAARARRRIQLSDGRLVPHA